MAQERKAKPRRSRLDAEELSILCEQFALILRSKCHCMTVWKP